MTGNPALANVLALAGCLACLCILSATGPAHAQAVDASESAAIALFRFDIQAGWLGQALDEYSNLTGLAILIDSANAQHRTGALSGMYSAADALQKLLSGTGLQGRYADARSIVITASSDARQAVAAPDGPDFQDSQDSVSDIAGIQNGGADYRVYIGRVQQALRTTLCGSAGTRPGPYRLALQLRFDARGRVERFRLLDTTGDAARDGAVARAVQAMAVGAPPPPSMPQPVSILLLPEAPNAHTDCAPPAAGER
jgi:hypothetical protein